MVAHSRLWVNVLILRPLHAVQYLWDMPPYLFNDEQVGYSLIRAYHAGSLGETRISLVLTLTN